MGKGWVVVAANTIEEGGIGRQFCGQGGRYVYTHDRGILHSSKVRRKEVDGIRFVFDKNNIIAHFSSVSSPRAAAMHAPPLFFPERASE
jgi:hypothetical protein